MKMKLLRLMAIALLGTLFSCSKKPVEVTGQLFVVTEDRDNIKMGGVQVWGIPDEDFVEAAKEVLPWFIEKATKEAQLRTDAWNQSEVLSEIREMDKGVGKSIPELEEICEELVEESGIPEDYLRREVSKHLAVDLAGGGDPIYHRATSKLLDSIEEKQGVTTDADGQFSVEAKGKTWFIAASERSVDGKKESYLWIKGFEPVKGSSKASVVISNDADIDSDQQLYELISRAFGTTGEIEELWAAGQVDVSEKLKSLFASKRKAAEAAKAKAMREVAEARVMAAREAAEARAKAKHEAAEAKVKAEREAAELLAKRKANRAGAEREFEIEPGVKMSFCWCPAGEFLMGSPESEAGRGDDEDQVKVTLSKGFWMAKTEVTQAQWEAVMGENPSEFKGGNRPVENVSWNDAQEFLQKLNARMGNADGAKMVLPTEAQWEYAARAGYDGRYAGGGSDEVAWYAGNSGGQTHLVGTKKANAWGLHDMSGNVWEWCQDWYGSKPSGGTDPSGPSSGTDRVLRGGSCRNNALRCRVAHRDFNFRPTSSTITFGFRVAAVQSPRTRR